MRGNIISALVGVMVYALVLGLAGITQAQEQASDPTDTLDGSKNFAEFYDNAEAGFMQLVTVPMYEGSDGPLDPEGYLWVNVRAEQIGYETFAVSSVEFDLRTGVGCYVTWEPKRGSFCISGPDMRDLFERGAYFLAYRSY